LHGLSAFGFAARGLISEVGNNDPRSLKFFGTRFTAPVSPGDALETQAWEVCPGPNGTIEVAFITKNTTSGKVRNSNYAVHIFQLLRPGSIGWRYCLHQKVRKDQAVIYDHTRYLYFICL
jgi:MaoC like domain